MNDFTQVLLKSKYLMNEVDWSTKIIYYLPWNATVYITFMLAMSITANSNQ